MKTKLQSIITLGLVLVSVGAFASTPPEHVDGIDRAREGNLKKLVLQEFIKTQKVDCGVSEIPKFEITKISAASNNEEKIPGTPYDYAATYLAVQKCLYGSTYVGAYIEPKKTAIMSASFISKYDRDGGPLNMEGLSIKSVRDVDLTVPED
jgi:hypothetical protein